MQFLSFNFCHPFKGNVKLIRLSKILPKTLNLFVDSKNSHNFEIPVDECEDGEWKVTLNWRQNHMSYFYEKIFNVKDANVLEVEAC